MVPPWVEYQRQALRSTDIREWQGSLIRAKNLLRDSWPLIISFISIGIYQRFHVDQGARVSQDMVADLNLPV